MPSAAAIVLGIALFGGGTLGLDTADLPEEPVITDADPVPGEVPTPSVPAIPGAVGLGALAAVLAATRRGDG